MVRLVTLPFELMLGAVHEVLKKILHQQLARHEMKTDPASLRAVVRRRQQTQVPGPQQMNPQQGEAFGLAQVRSHAVSQGLQPRRRRRPTPAHFPRRLVDDRGGVRESDGQHTALAARKRLGHAENQRRRDDGRPKPPPHTYYFLSNHYIFSNFPFFLNFDYL